MPVAVTLCAALGGFLFGYDTSVINGAVFQMKDHFHFESGSWEYALIVAIAIVGAFFGALGNAFFATRFGRRWSLIVADIFFIVGSVIMGASVNVEMVIISRLIVGLGIGVSSSIVPVYLAEITPPKSRGATVAVNSCFITGGQFLTAGFTALLVVFTGTNVGWRVATAVGAVPALVQLLGVVFGLPESPRWLLSRGRHEEAQRVADKFGIDLGEFDPNEKLSLDVRPLVSRAMRYRLFVGCMMMAIQQFAGINTIMYYSSVILEAAGFDDPTMPVIMSVPLAFVNAVFTIVAFFTIDRFGRRTLLLFSCGGYGIMMIVVTVVGFLLGKQIPYNIGGWLFVALLCVMLAFFAPGMGAVPWALSEMYPNNLRASAAAVATMCNWAANAVVSEVFPILLGIIGVGPVFCIFAVIVLLSWFFIFFFVLETKGLSLEEIDNMFRIKAGLEPHELHDMQGFDYEVGDDDEGEEMENVVSRVQAGKQQGGANKDDPPAANSSDSKPAGNREGERSSYGGTDAPPLHAAEKQSATHTVSAADDKRLKEVPKDSAFTDLDRV